jgi:hypothetical protein
MVALGQEAGNIKNEGIVGGIGVIDGSKRSAFVIATLRASDSDVTDCDYSNGVGAEGWRPEG